MKKQIPKKNVPKRTQQQKPKDTQTHTQNVYINTQRQQRVQSSVRKSNHNTISTPITVPFVQPLPDGHPFNKNVPQNKSGVSSNETVNPNVVQQISQLQKDVQKINETQHARTQKTPVKLNIKKLKGPSKKELIAKCIELGID